MIRRTKRSLSLVLIATMSFMDIVLVTGACEASRCALASAPCCGACCTHAGCANQACCSESAEPSACQCSVDQKRPAAPPERSGGDEQKVGRRLVCEVATCFLPNDAPRLWTAQDASLLSSLPASRRQADLCRWLI